MQEFVTYNNFDSIIIIESLPKNESQTGLFLQREVLYTECQLKSTSLSYINCEGRDQFFAIFENLKRNLIIGDNSIIGGDAKYPILHFEIHGAIDKSGLVLKNGEYINWLEFDRCCRRINELTYNNLLVVLAVCNGYYAAQKVILSKLIPFYALIGSPSTIYVQEIKEIFPRFYRTLFDSGDLLLSFDEVRMKCKLFHCEMVLMDIMAHYFLTHCEGEALELRAKSIIEKLKANKPNDVINNKEKIISALKPSLSIFNKYKENFLMSEHPRNTDRFSLKYDDILKYMDRIRPNFT